MIAPHGTIGVRAGAEAEEDHEGLAESPAVHYEVFAVADDARGDDADHGDDDEVRDEDRDVHRSWA